MKKYVCKFLLAASFYTSLFSAAYAQTDVSSSVTSDFRVSVIEFYGHEVNPYRQPVSKLQEGSLTWDGVKHLMPEIFPDYMTKTVEINALCSEMFDLALLYGNQNETNVARFFNHLPKFDEPKEEYELFDFVMLPLTSQDNAKFLELLDIFPGMEDQIMMARDLAMKALLVYYLREAVLDHCPEFVAEKRLIGLSKPYTPNVQQEQTVPGQIVP